VGLWGFGAGQRGLSFLKAEAGSPVLPVLYSLGLVRPQQANEIALSRPTNIGTIFLNECVWGQAKFWGVAGCGAERPFVPQGIECRGLEQGKAPRLRHPYIS